MIVLFDHLQDLAWLYTFGRLKGGERYPFAALIKDPQRAIIGPDKRYCPLKNPCRHLLEIGMRVKGICHLKQCVSPSAFLLLSYKKTRVLVADGQLASDGLQK